MNRTIISVILFSIFYLCSCENQRTYDQGSTFTMSDIPEKITLKGEKVILDDDVMKPVNLYVKDSILFVINAGMEYFLSCYNLVTSKKTGEYISFGSGPNEVLNLSLQFTDDCIWSFDMQRKRLSQYTFDQFLNERESSPHSKITIDGTIVKALVVKDKIFTNMRDYPDFRFTILNMEGKFVKNAGAMPDEGIDMSPFEKFEAYIGNMVVSPDNLSVFVGYMDTDLIEIYDSEGNLKVRKHGPDGFFTARREVHSGNVSRFGYKKGEARNAYYSPIAFEDEIWARYSGKVYDSSIPDDYMSNNIIVFNWNGDPLRIYTTDIPFYSLAVDRKNHTIYAVTIDPEFSIVKYEY
jgi:hypothetical protein